MDTRTLIILLSPLVALQLILIIALVINLVRKDLPWAEKWFWFLLIPISIIGPIFYFVVVSNMLDEKASNKKENE